MTDAQILDYLQSRLRYASSAFHRYDIVIGDLAVPVSKSCDLREALIGAISKQNAAIVAAKLLDEPGPPGAYLP